MTKKHYEAIAGAIKTEKDSCEFTGEHFSTEYISKEAARGALISIAYSLSTIFANDNPNFNRARFLTACGF